MFLKLVEMEHAHTLSLLTLFLYFWFEIHNIIPHYCFTFLSSMQRFTEKRTCCGREVNKIGK